MQYDIIGIIGLGFVGNAIVENYKTPSVTTVIIDPGKGYHNSYNDLKNCSAVFVCVPSPQGEDGSCDTTIFESVLENLNAINFTGVIISKVTAPPEVYKRLQEKHMNLVHVPEFLTAANAVEDYRIGEMCFIGGKAKAFRNEAQRIIVIGQQYLKNIIHCSIQEASLVKYTMNCFLATKVIFMNEVAKLAEANDCNWIVMQEMLEVDHRIGSTHLQVPGPDGKFGFGGMCFPKDTSAMLKFAEQAGQQMNVLEAVVKKNTLLRLKND
jgi:UDPglucose 6-dehydrogenase